MMINYLPSLMPLKEFKLDMKCVALLHKKNPSWRLTVIRAAAVIIVFCCYPLILCLQYIWNALAWKLLPLRLRRKMGRPIPGSLDPPLLGETLEYQLDREKFLRFRFLKYGPMFRSALDFSGTYLWAEEVIFCLDDSISTKVQPVGALLGYCGFFGYNSDIPLDKVGMVADILFNDRQRLDQWEKLIIPIIQQFLFRLSFEQDFAFAEKVNELACELTSTLILGMTGYSARLQHLLDNYLLKGQLDDHVNKSDYYREHMKAFIQSAIREEDRKTVSSSARKDIVDGESGTPAGTLLGRLLVEIAAALESEDVIGSRGVGRASGSRDRNEDTVGDLHISDEQVIDFIFILMADVFYRSLVQHLRSLLFVLLTNKGDLMMVAITALEAYHKLAIELASNRDLLPQIQAIGLGMGPESGGVTVSGHSSGFRWSPFLRNDPDPFARVEEDDGNDDITQESQLQKEAPLTSPLERVIHAAWHLMGNDGTSTKEYGGSKRRGLLHRMDSQHRSSERMRGSVSAMSPEKQVDEANLQLEEGENFVEDDEEHEDEEIDNLSANVDNEDDGSHLDHSDERGYHDNGELESDSDTVDMQRGSRNQMSVPTGPISPDHERLHIRTTTSNDSPLKIMREPYSSDSYIKEMQPTPRYEYGISHPLNTSGETPRQSYMVSGTPMRRNVPPKRQDLSNKQRDRLNIASKAYCRSVEDIAESAVKAAILPSIPLQFSLYRIHTPTFIETTSIVNPASYTPAGASSVEFSPMNHSNANPVFPATFLNSNSSPSPHRAETIPAVISATYDLHPGDLLCMINHMPGTKEKPSAEQFLDLGLLGKLIMMSFTHELLANYRWKFERNYMKISAQLKASPSFTSICNAAFSVSGFHKRIFAAGQLMDPAARNAENKNLYREQKNEKSDTDKMHYNHSTSVPQTDGYISDGL